MNMLVPFEKFKQSAVAMNANAELRQKAFEYLSQNGLPTRKNEDWKYTSLKSLSEETFAPADATLPVLSSASRAHIESKLHSGFINLVFHNGVLDSTLSSVLPKGVQIKTVSDASGAASVVFQDALEALNTVYQAAHYRLEVDPMTSVPMPVQLLFYTSLSESAPVMVHPKVTVKVGARSSAQIIESYFGEAYSRYFVNASVQVKVDESAKLVYVRLQAESKNAMNIGRTSFDLAPHSSLHSLVFSTGAQLSRHNLDLVLKAEDTSATIDGVYLVKGQQHVDNATLIHHVMGGCSTSQHYKGILADEARAVFNGKVVIGKGAQKANSAQLNNNLLLSRKAEADSKPQLEVYADDVKASHGSTVGQLNREELFYLESRAIAPEVAIPMLSFGYASELIYKIENEELQRWLNSQLKEAFQGLTLGNV